MRITGVRYRKLDLGAHEKALRNSRLTFQRPRASMVEVLTDEGITGVALTAGRAGFGERVYVEGPLQEAVLGKDPFTVARLWDTMMSGWRKPVTKGEVVSSISGVDIAVWDLIGKALERPLYQLLGGYRDEVPVYAAGGYYADGKGTEALVEEMAGYLAHGFRAVKMKVGGSDLRTDVARVAAVRAAVGDDVELMLDANYAWRSDEALRFVRAVEEYDPFWLEEPTHPDDVRGLLRVGAAGGVPVASGENEFTRFGCHRLLDSGAVDFLQLDAYVGGGVTEWMRVAALASAYHVPMAPHGDHLVHLHLVAAVPNGLTVESYPEMHASLDRFVSTMEVVDGMASVPKGPGLGWELDWDFIERHTVED